MFENAALSSSANRRFLCEGIIFRKNGGLWLIFCVAQGWKVSFISEKFNSTWKVQDIWVVNQNSIVRFASYFFLSWQRVEGWSRCGRISTASSVFAYPSWTMAPNDYASKLHDVTLSRQHWSNSAPSPAGILSLFWALCPKLYGLKLTAWRGGTKRQRIYTCLERMEKFQTLSGRNSGDKAAAAKMQTRATPCQPAQCQWISAGAVCCALCGPRAFLTVSMRQHLKWRRSCAICTPTAHNLPSFRPKTYGLGQGH